MIFELENRTCRAEEIGKGAGPRPLIILLSDDGQEWDDIKKRLQSFFRDRKCRPFLMASFSVSDWSGEFSPWEFTEDNGRFYAGNADKTLKFVKKSLVPELSSRFELCGETYIAGYSLAGLCALYGCCGGDFTGGACCSGSVWYPGWMEYAEGHIPSGKIYLSLGAKEERTRHPLMSRVGECMRQMQALLFENGIETELFMEPGNHFNDVPGRMARAIAWLLSPETETGEERK